MDATGPTGGIESGTGDAGTGPTGDAGTGPTGDVGTGAMYFPPPEPAPDFLSLDDLLSDHAIVVAKEQADKNLLDQIGSQHVLALKPKLVT